MRRIRADTPELLVRDTLRRLAMAATGFTVHLPQARHRRRRKKAIFVNGCFWHGHECAEGSRKPKSNQEYWLPKIERTRERDRVHIDALEASGWAVLVLWECTLSDTPTLETRMRAFMER
jgi:DNA mismatch endonuclease (patch repair protein)